MFIAIHEPSDRLVSGAEVADPKSVYSDTDSYRCLLCDDSVEYVRDTEKHERFAHATGDRDCFYRPKNSHVHQLGCELAIKTACNQLGYDRDTVEIESEITVGGAMTRADVIIREPEPVVFEVYYKSRLCALHRKLNVILRNGYSCHVVCVVPGRYDPAYEPETFDKDLQKYGPVEVGRFVPEHDQLSVGTKITDEIVELVPPFRLDDSGHVLFG